uniref:Uncharacterized protein n=1 Tax=Amphimedon queenslandica TaxID=400682 RepID=A0A1X7VP15_AMPQE
MAALEPPNDVSNFSAQDNNGNGINYLDSQLHNDCLNGNDTVVDKFLSSRSDKEKRKLLNAINCNGYTPLHIACEQEHAEVVKILMKHGASPVICSKSDPLYQRLTNKSGDIELKRDDKSEERCQSMQQLLDSLHADEVNIHYFMKCVDRSNGRNICYRINSKFFVGSTPLHVAAKIGSLKILKILLPFLNESDINHIDNYKRTALYIACKEGHAQAARKLLEHGADTDITESTFERTPLHFACELGHVQLVELLLRHGANFNKLTNLDYTALHTASENGYAQVVELLLDHGADIKQTDTLGRPALQLACEKGHAQVVELLLKHGAYIELTHDSYNKEVMYTTLLVTACKSGHAKVVELLLEYDADITKCDENGLNPLDIAVEKGQTDVAMAIVNSIKWKKALCNTVTNRRDEKLRSRLVRQLRYNKTEPEFTTPMRRIINKMPDVAKIIFDRCCRTEASPDHPDYKITFNFEFLEDFNLDVNHESTKWPPQFDYSSQNHCLNILANSHSADLLKHPLARTLLNLKWNKYGKIFYYTNLMIYFLFVILLTSFALVLKSPNSSICMEAFGNDTNCSGGNHCYCTHSWQWQIGVIAVFLGWIALIFSIRKLPKFGIYVVEFILPMEEFLKKIVAKYIVIKQEQTMYPNKSGVLKQLIGYIFESKTEGSEPPPATIADVNTQIKPLSGEMKDLRTSVSQEVKKLHSSVSQEVKELRSSVDHLLAIVESMRNERARELSSETIGIRGSIGAKDRAKIEEEQGDF